MAFNPKEHMMSLKGKDYLQVMWRLVWFREEHSDWQIATQLIEHKHGEYAVFKAEIIEPHTEHTLASGYGSESVKDFKDYLEKAETKAIGRALAILGYGTQFAPELDEGDRIVDSPVTTKETKTAPKKAYTVNNPTAKDIEKIAKDIVETDREKVIRIFYSSLDEPTQNNVLKGLNLEKIEDIKEQADIDKLFNHYVKWEKV